MPKEILLYSSIYSWSAADIIRQLDENKNSEIVFRINSFGGSVLDGFGIFAKLREVEKKLTVKVDGFAGSMSAMLCCYIEDVECLDVSEFLFHRAAYPDFIEDDPEYFTQDLCVSLAKTNAQLRAAMEAKMDPKKFQKETGVSYDQLFSLDTRIDVTLDAEQALRLGLVNKITQLTPDRAAEIESTAMGLAASVFSFKKPSQKKAQITDPTKVSTMNINEFRQQHPELFAQVQKEAVDGERDRVGSLLAYIDVDHDGVSKMIKEGGQLTQTLMAEYGRKIFASSTLEGIKNDSAKTLPTDEDAAVKKASEAEKETFDKEWKAALKTM